MPQLGLGLGLDLASGHPDADAASFITRAGITNPTQKVAINTFVGGLKNKGLWNKLTLLYPFVGGTAGAHAQNLRSSSFAITWVNGPTHSANGVTGNGTTQYGNTNFNMSNIIDMADAHLATYWAGGTTTGDVAGAWDGGQRIFSMEGALGGGVVVWIYDCNHLVDGRMNATTDQQALQINTRVSLTAAFAYGRGIQTGTKAGLIPQPLQPNVNCLLMARSDGGTPNWFMNGDMRLMSLGTGLTAQNAADYHTLVQAFQTTLGRQV